MSMNKYPRGSEWRKWDLHIHTPGTAKNDHFGNDEDVWEKYITKLESNADIAVLGITDYFSIDNYLYLKKKQEEGRLANITLIPNIELRILPVTQKDTPINIHVLFDPNLPKDTIEREFFQCLKFKYLDNEYSCLKRDLIALGRAYKHNEDLEEECAKKEGISQFNVSYADLNSIIKKPSLHDHVILAVSNSNRDGNSGIQHSSLAATRQEIYRMSHIIFSANDKDVRFFLGKGVDDENTIKQHYGSLKPCVIGSDAHSLDEVNVFPNNKCTWIKADPTFEGLKQVMYEPEERVRIQTTIPDDKNIYQILDKVVLNEEGFWNGTICFNSNLNTIIGGRSTGKSNLLKAIAAVHNHPGVEGDDFIMKHLGGVSIQWKDGTDQIGREIEYFKQSYIHDIASKANKTSELVESIIRNRDKSGVVNMYYAHLNDVSKKITEQMFSLFQTSKELSEKRKELNALGKKDGVVQQITILKTKVNELQKLSKFTLEQQAVFDADVQKIKALNLEMEKADNDLKILEKLLIVTPFDFSFEKQWQMDKLSFKLNQYDLLREYKNLKIKTEQEFIALVRKYQLETIHAKNDIQEQCRVIKESETFKNGIKFIEGNKELKDISDRITAEEKKLALIEQLEATIEKIKTDCNTLFASIIDIHCSIKEKAVDVEKQLNISYDGLSITVKLEHHRDALQSFLEDRLNLRGNERQDYCIKIVRNYDSDNRTYAKDFLYKLIKGELQLKNGYEALNVATEFFAKSWYGIGFELCYQGDSFKQMSEGKQAFVILKLLLDFSEKKCPILIDQPEDSLDNRAIYNDLVSYIKRKKRERQIILITHNSNVVVSADAENVIVANQEGSDSHNRDGLRFQYVNGALEETHAKDNDEPSVLYSQGIREHVCEILEGGVEAFKIREQKYGI